MRLFIKGGKKNATREAARRGIPVSNCKPSNKGDAVMCDAPESARVKVMHWLGDRSSIIRRRRGYTPGALLFFSGAKRGRRRR